MHRAYFYPMEVKEVLCYNKERNEFRPFNAHIVDARFIKSTGFAPVEEVKEEPLLCQSYASKGVETVYPALESCKSSICSNTTEPEVKPALAKRSHKKKK